ncbi:MAG: F0F1 ATP synthase subunit alpha, partial [Armatimonadetes bacterium CG07_land_8_20_14_0_80_40_9]
GVRPAVNVGLSVSRVGGNAQIKAMKQIAGMLRLELAQYRELAAFSQFATELDKATRARLERGIRIVEILKQAQYQPMPVEEQIMIIFVGVNGYLDDLPVEKIKLFEEEFYKFMRDKYPQISLKIKKTKELAKETEEELKKAISEFKKEFK